MDNTTDDTHLIDAHEEIYILDAEKEEIFEYLNENTITEEELEELENIYTYIDHNFPSPTIKSGLMNTHNNDPDNFIDDPEYFCSITDDSYVNTKKTAKQVPTMLEMHNWMEDRTPTCSPTSLFSLSSYL